MSKLFGRFTEGALEFYQKSLLEGESFNFSEGGYYDFTLCLRPNGTYYGTGGKCRKGTEADPKDKDPHVNRLSGHRLIAATAMLKNIKTAAREEESGLQSIDRRVSEGLKKAGLPSEKEILAASKKKPGSAKEEKLSNDERIDKAQLEANLSPSAKKALFDYTKGSNAEDEEFTFFKMNDDLRNGGVEGKMGKWVSKMDSALESLPKNPSQEPYYRAVSVRRWELKDYLGPLKKGEVVSDAGFGSYSRSKDVAKTFFEDDGDMVKVMFVSRNPSLTPMNMFSAHPHEKEAIMPRDSYQTITGVSRDKSEKTIYVELD
jgi:hypothetical protein